MHKVGKKGFTLIELLGVIVLLGVIAVLVVTVTMRIIKNSKESMYETQIEILTQAAKKWSIQNSNEMPMSSQEGPYNLPLSKLYEDGFIDSDDLTDPRDKKDKQICGYIKITYNDTKKQYDYKLIKETC